MPLPDYDETLMRYGLTGLRARADIQVTDSGDIAVTRDGDLQMGDRQTNALFRLVERWRWNEPTVRELFDMILNSARQLDDLNEARADNKGPVLHIDPKAFHEISDLILEYQSITSVLAGSIFVVLNNLLQRFRQDLDAEESEWRAAHPIFESYSLGQIVSSAAANFRHSDEWASVKSPTMVQRQSMEVICGLLKRPVQMQKGYPTIRSNVCGSILITISESSFDRLNQLVFDFAKALAKYPKGP
ncbi:MAG TPA: hypothetical protein VGI93_09645 [Steroidobacteraceae bacterium]|jgi:hypothetical protein